MQATQEMVELSIKLHLIFIISIILVKIRIMFLIKNRDLAKRYQAWVLYDRAILSALLFSGVTVMAITHFDVAWQVWLMVVLALVMLYLSIREFMLYKYTNLETVLTFLQKKYPFEIVAILLISLASLI